MTPGYCLTPHIPLDPYLYRDYCRVADQAWPVACGYSYISCWERRPLLASPVHVFSIDVQDMGPSGFGLWPLVRDSVSSSLSAEGLGLHSCWLGGGHSLVLTAIHWCWQSFTDADSHSLMLTAIHWCWWPFTGADGHSLMLKVIRWCRRAFTDADWAAVIHWCWRSFTDADGHSMVLTVIHWCWMSFTDVKGHSLMLMAIHWCWRSFTDAEGHSLMLTTIHRCWLVGGHAPSVNGE